MTDETRITSATGGAKGDKIYRFDQIPAAPMLELAARYGLGSTKYPQANGLDNWRNGYPFSLSMAALERHYYAFKNGEDNDSTIYAEAGLLGEGEHPLYDAGGKLRPGVSHLAAVVWHCFFLMHHLVEHPELDDRPSTVEKQNNLRKTMEPMLEYYNSKLLDRIEGNIFRAMAPAPMTPPAAFDSISPSDHRDRVIAWRNRPISEGTVAATDLVSPPVVLSGKIQLADRRVTEWEDHFGISIKDYDGFTEVDTYAKIGELDFLNRVNECTVDNSPKYEGHWQALSLRHKDLLDAEGRKQ